MNGIRGDELENRLAAPGGRSDGSPLPSRCRAIDGLRAHVLAGNPAPALLTGEPGTGKTWVWKALARELTPGWRALPVTLSGALDAAGLLELIADGLHGDHAELTPRSLAANRLAIARMLREDADDSRRWILVIEDAQNASREVWEELAALAQASDTGASSEPAGFAGMLLVGPTSLTRLLMERRRNPLAERLGLHVHLLPLDTEECRALIDAADAGPTQGLDRSAVEELQRRSAGNPRQLLRVIGSQAASLRPGLRSAPGEAVPVPVSPPRRPAAAPRERPIPAANPPGPARPAAGRQAALIPTRPPLRVEEGLIEVGWEGSLEADAEEADSGDQAEFSAKDSTEPTAMPSLPPVAGSLEATTEALTSAEDAGELPSEEMIEDHYAAIQAWSEWARNRGRAADPVVVATSESVDRRSGTRSQTLAVTDEAEPDGSDADLLSSNVRVEAEHEHAPYSQIFSRLRQARP